MGRPYFGLPAAHPVPLVAHVLHDDNVNVVYGNVAEGVHNGLPAKAMAELEPALPLRCRWKVPLTRVHNSFGVLLLYQDHLDAQNLNQVMVYVNVDGSIVICRSYGSHTSESWLTSYQISA